MPRTRECDYCDGEIEPGTGTMLVRTDGTAVWFCSSKCERNYDLGREPRDVEWTAEGSGAGRPGAAPDEPEEEQESAEASDSNARSAVTPVAEDDGGEGA